jgi:hypothetical protein
MCTCRSVMHCLRTELASLPVPCAFPVSPVLWRLGCGRETSAPPSQRTEMGHAVRANALVPLCGSSRVPLTLLLVLLLLLLLAHGGREEGKGLRATATAARWLCFFLACSTRISTLAAAATQANKEQHREEKEKNKSKSCSRLMETARASKTGHRATATIHTQRVDERGEQAQGKKALGLILGGERRPQM